MERVDRDGDALMDRIISRAMLFMVASLFMGPSHTAVAEEQRKPPKPPITLESMGAYEVGGKVVAKPGDPPLAGRRGDRWAARPRARRHPDRDRRPDFHLRGGGGRGQAVRAAHALVNCGGATTPVPAADLEGLTDDIFDRTVTLNLRGPFAMVRAFRPLLDRDSGAAIVNISSIAARTGLGSSLAYLAAKAGVDALTIALAKVLAPRIRVFSVSPAGVDTDFVAGRTREQLQKTAEKLPLAHVTTPDDVARAVVACIVNLTSSTGIVVPVDEGRHL